MPHPGSASLRGNLQCLKVVYNKITLNFFSFFAFVKINAMYVTLIIYQARELCSEDIHVDTPLSINQEFCSERLGHIAARNKISMGQPENHLLGTFRKVDERDERQG